MAKKQESKDQFSSFIDKSGSYVSSIAQATPPKEEGCRKEKYGRDFACNCKKCSKNGGKKNEQPRY